MIKAQYTLISEVQRNGLLGKMDYLGVFDRLYAPTLPAAQPQMTLSFAVYAETEDDLGKKNFALRCVDPQGNPVFEQRGTLDLKPGAGTWLASQNLHFQMQGFPITSHGRYWFRLSVDGSEIAAAPLSVVNDQPPKS
jgi:hypothetical protein